MITVAVVVLLLLGLFLSGLTIDYWQRWRTEKLWAEHLQSLLAETRRELVHEKRLRMIKGDSDCGTAGD